MPLSEHYMPPLEERVQCSIIAAVSYQLPVNILLAVAEQENGKPGQWVENTNGSHDVGALQFNTRYLSELARYGITAADVAKPGCYAYELAAWRLRGHLLNDSGDLWTRVANYHSRTPKYNARYRQLIIQRAVKWADWLDQHFSTQTLAQYQVTAGQPALSGNSALEYSQVLAPTRQPSGANAAQAKEGQRQPYTPRTLTIVPR